MPNGFDFLVHCVFNLSVFASNRLFACSYLDKIASFANYLTLNRKHIYQGTFIKEIAKKYYKSRCMSVHDPIESYQNELRLVCGEIRLTYIFTHC